MGRVTNVLDELVVDIEQYPVRGVYRIGPDGRVLLQPNKDESVGDWGLTSLIAEMEQAINVPGKADFYALARKMKRRIYSNWAATPSRVVRRLIDQRTFDASLEDMLAAYEPPSSEEGG